MEYPVLFYDDNGNPLGCADNIEDAMNLTGKSREEIVYCLAAVGIEVIGEPTDERSVATMPDQGKPS